MTDELLTTPVIDNMGAPADTPWRPHRTPVPLVDFPGSGAVIGTLMAGDQCSGVVRCHRPSDTEWLHLSDRLGFASLTALHRVHPDNHPVDGVIPVGRERVNRWWGMGAEYVPTDLRTIPEAMTSAEPDKEYRVRAPALEALTAMLSAAATAGLVMRVGSAYRSWERQKQLFDRAVERDGPAQRYSAPPGHSEHQLGTAVDLCDGQLQHFITASFGETPEYAWLVRHAPRFGWRQSYLRDNTSETGYICEPWHWRFIGTAPFR